MVRQWRSKLLDAKNPEEAFFALQVYKALKKELELPRFVTEHLKRRLER